MATGWLLKITKWSASRWPVLNLNSIWMKLQTGSGDIVKDFHNLIFFLSFSVILESSDLLLPSKNVLRAAYNKSLGSKRYDERIINSEGTPRNSKLPK